MSRFKRMFLNVLKGISLGAYRIHFTKKDYSLILSRYNSCISFMFILHLPLVCIMTPISTLLENLLIVLFSIAMISVVN